MFIVQTSRAKRTRKYSTFMVFVLFLFVGFAGWMAIFTLHWDVLPEKK